MAKVINVFPMIAYCLDVSCDGGVAGIQLKFGAFVEWEEVPSRRLADDIPQRRYVLENQHHSTGDVKKEKHVVKLFGE